MFKRFYITATNKEDGESYVIFKKSFRKSNTYQCLKECDEPWMSKQRCRGHADRLIFRNAWKDVKIITITVEEYGGKSI